MLEGGKGEAALKQRTDRDIVSVRVGVDGAPKVGCAGDDRG